MRLLSQLKWLIFSLLAIQLIACSSILQKPTTQVEIAPNTWISIPLPSELGYSLDASQLIEARWQDKNHQWQQQQLPIQLQVNSEIMDRKNRNDGTLQLVGFSSWGTPLLSLNYSPQSLDTNVMVGLGAQLPQPEQILFNLMITLWPLEAWQARLESIGWHIEESALSRTVFDQNNQKVIEIIYSKANWLDGDIIFTHRKFNYQITIKTPDYRQKRVKIEPNVSELK